MPMCIPRLARVLALGVTCLLGSTCLAEDLARLFPSDTLAYVGWSNSQASTDPDVRLATELMRATPALGEEFDSAGIAAALSDVYPILAASPVAVGLLDVRFKESGPEIVAAAVIAAGDSSDKLASTFDKLLRESNPKLPVQDATIGGAKLRTIPIPESPFALFWGAHKGHFLLTLGQAAAEMMLERIDGKAKDKSLLDNEEFQFDRRKTKASDSAKWMWCAFANVKTGLAKARSIAEQAGDPFPPQADTILAALGVSALQSIYLHGQDDPHRGVVRGFLHVQGELRGILSLWKQTPLTDDEIKIIPKDAYWGSVNNLDLAKLWTEVLATVEAIDESAVPQVESGVAMSRAFLGFSVTDDLLPALGDTWALFDAPNHGGLLATGTVLAVEARDAAAIDGILRRLVQTLAPIAARNDVHVGLHESKLEGRDVRYVMIGGVPCPIVPAWGFAGQHWVFGLFPQSVAAAMEQVDPQTRKGSVLDRDDVKAVRGMLGEKPLAFGFSDTRYMGRLFYPLGLLYTNAIASFGTSQQTHIDPTLYPLVARMLEGIHTVVGVTTVDSDGILYAQAGSGTGASVMAAAGAGGLAVSILLPSLSRARELAKRTVCASNLRGIGQGCFIYANDHDEKLPENLNELITGGMCVPEMFICPNSTLKPDQVAAILNGAPGPHCYIYISGQTFNTDVRNVLIYEALELHKGEGGNVLYMDGHVEFLKPPRYQQEIRETYKRLNREDEMPARFRETP